jgi:hypothetical protein
MPWLHAIGTLLSVLRGNKINVWDPDSDLGIIYPGDDEIEAMIQRFPRVLADEARLRGYDPRQVELVYHRDRYDILYCFIIVMIYMFAANSALIQIQFHEPVAHSDIWLWREQKGSKRPPRPAGHVIDAPDAEAPPVMKTNDGSALDDAIWIYNDDYVVASSPRLKSDVIPVITRSWSAQRLNMTVPYDAALAARFEFGSGYMTPLLYRIQCEENLFLGRLNTSWYITAAIAITLITIVVTHVTPALPFSILPPQSRLALP